MKKTLILAPLFLIGTVWVYAANSDFNILDENISLELKQWEIISKNLSENVENPQNKDLKYEIKTELNENFSFDENTKTIKTKENLAPWEHSLNYEVCEEMEKTAEKKELYDFKETKIDTSYYL